MNQSAAKAHVLYVLPVLKPAGAERIVADLAKSILDHGFSCSVACLEDENEAIGRELVAAGIAVTGLHRHRWRSRACARDLAGILPKTRPLIVHSHLFHANYVARLAIRRLAGQSR